VALFRALAANHTWITPTLTVADGLTRIGRRDSMARDPRYLIEPLPPTFTAETRNEEEQARAARLDELQRRLVREMHAAGASILAGTDTPVHAVPGASLHGELTLLNRAGLTAAETLRSATLEPARYLGATDSLGTVRAGRVADLVVLRRDPLVDVRNTRTIEMVVTRGRVLRRADLDRLLEEGTRALHEVRAALESMHAGSTAGRPN
jgi:imidazolonepropionase-like amidohydrolase